MMVSPLSVSAIQIGRCSFATLKSSTNIALMEDVRSPGKKGDPIYLHALTRFSQWCHAELSYASVPTALSPIARPLEDAL